MILGLILGFLAGAGIVTAALFYRLGKMVLTCSGILAIGSSNEMFLDLKEPVDDVRKHGIIHLQVKSIETEN